MHQVSLAQSAHRSGFLWLILQVILQCPKCARLWDVMCYAGSLGKALASIALCCMHLSELYVSCHRDAQIQEKKHMLQEEEEEERALDLQMEIDRLRALEAYEERERQRMAESRVGAQILNEQIVERKRERVHQEELRDLVCVLCCPLSF